MIRVRALAIAVALLCLACSSGGDASTAASSTTAGNAAPTSAPAKGWTFTDDRGVTHELDAVPDTIAAQSVAAGGLWEYGITAAGVFGPLRRPDGTPDTAVGLADPAVFKSLGEVDSEINLEQLAGLRADIIVTAMWGDDMYWGIDDEEIDEIEQIAPIVGIRVDKRSIDKPLARFAELARSLGAPDAKIADARAKFTTASNRLRASLARKTDFVVVAASGTPAEMYVAWPGGFPDLRYYQSLGMDLVEPEKHPTSNGFWETLSWEEAGKYPADFVLADARGGTVEQILTLIPATAASFPAVAAGQMVSWPTVHAYGFGNLAAIMDGLTEAIDKASPDIV